MPKNMNDLSSDDLTFNEVDHYEDEDFDMAQEETFEDYSDMETFEDDPGKEIAYSEPEIKAQSILQAIFFALIGKKTEYTSIDQKLQNNKTAKMIFFISTILFLIVLFIVLMIVVK